MGGGKGGNTTVQAPDPRQIARTDVDFNRIDQFTPLGNLQFSGPNKNVSTLTLDPRVQGLFESQLAQDQFMLDEAARRQSGLQNLPELTRGLDTSGLPGLQRFDTSGLPQLQQFDPSQISSPGFGGPTTQDIPQLGDDFESARSSVENAQFDRGSNLLNRQFDRDEDRLRQSLANRGLTGAGTEEIGEAANTELGLFNQNKNDAFENLALQSVLSGGQEQSRLFGLDEAAARFQLGGEQQRFGQDQGTFDARNAMRGNQLQDFLVGNEIDQQIRQQDISEQIQNTGIDQQIRQQGISEQLQNANIGQTNRGTEFNELAALLGMQQVAQPGLNNFFSPSTADVTGAFGLNQNAQIENARNAQANQSDLLGGLFGLGSAAINRWGLF